MKIIYLIILGFGFGWILIASQAFSWYRIQEMFHFQSFHMYGLLSSAILTALITSKILKKIKNIPQTDKTYLPIKAVNLKSNIGGGVLFGIGWGLAGTCTAPVYITLGLNWKIGILLFLGTLIGATIFYYFNQQKK
jgi:uncharacterized membrane protein YedE/YeeE